MPLPKDQTQWPPDSMKPVYSKFSEWAAWYSGEPSRIIDAYASQSVRSQAPWWRFWRRAAQGSADGSQRAMLHVPIASDLAAVSGALLFGEAPVVRIRSEEAEVEAVERATKAKQADAERTAARDKLAGNPFEAGNDEKATAFGAPAEKEPAAPTSAETHDLKTEKRLREIIEGGGVHARLVEAAESAAALGGVYIYPVWDKDLRDFPLLAIAQSDMAIPDFKHGVLKAVTFFRQVEDPDGGKEIYRIIERHEVEGTGDSRKAVVLSALYKGTAGNVGVQVSLGQAGIAEGVEARVELPFKELDVEYVPNIRPNRLWRASPLGVADIQGSESLLDALDEVYASWLRDVRLAKARIIVPREYLRKAPDDDGNETGTPSFDIDQEIYVGMDMEPGLTQDARAMMAHQFEIRYEEHRATARDLIERISSNAGYTPSTLHGAGSTGGDQASGTQLRISEHRTLLTLRRKSGWWKAAVANVLHHMLLIDNEVFDQSNADIRPAVTLADSIIDQPLELAQTALALKSAEAASTETRVRMVHPEWSNAEVEAEVARIDDELKAAEPPMPDLGGAFGNPEDDEASTSKKPMTKGEDSQQDGPPTDPKKGE